MYREAVQSEIRGDEAADMLLTIVGELRIIAQRLQSLSGTTQPDELLLTRRFVAMAAEQAVQMADQAICKPRAVDLPPRRIRSSGNRNHLT